MRIQYGFMSFQRPSDNSNFHILEYEYSFFWKKMHSRWAVHPLKESEHRNLKNNEIHQLYCTMHNAIINPLPCFALSIKRFFPRTFAKECTEHVSAFYIARDEFHCF